MNDPYGPYRPGSGGQPDFAQQPSGFPQPGFPHQGGFPQFGQPPVVNAQPGQPQSGPAAPARGVFGIAAAALAGVAAVIVFGVLLAGVVAMLVDVSNGRMGLGEALGTIVGNLLVIGGYGLLWLFGAIKLYKPKKAGRGLVIAGSALAVPIAVVGLAATYTDATRDGRPAFFLVWTVVLIYVLTTLVLAMLPATGAWIRANQPAAPEETPPQPFSPFQGYPVQNPGYPPHHG
ncbi:hypothetical protein [Mycolicibacterium sp. XJ775]